MSYLRSMSILIAFALLLLTSGEEGGCRTRKPGGAAKAEKPMPIKMDEAPQGTWGAEHALMRVTDGGADLDFDCAHGAITEPLALDGNGRFDVAGVYVQEHGGPVRLGEENTQPARYAGQVQGRVLTLTIKLGQSEEVIGPLAFTLGRATRIIKCQ